MTDTKISSLPPATVLDGTELVPIVQGGVTVKASAADLAKVGNYYHFTQSNPLTAWTINHNLGRYPSVTVTDSSGNVGYGTVAYSDANNLSVSFASAFSGDAYLN